MELTIESIQQTKYILASLKFSKNIKNIFLYSKITSFSLNTKLEKVKQKMLKYIFVNNKLTTQVPSELFQ